MVFNCSKCGGVKPAKATRCQNPCKLYTDKTIEKRSTVSVKKIEERREEKREEKREEEEKSLNSKVSHKQEMAIESNIQQPVKGFQRRPCPITLAGNSKLSSNTIQCSIVWKNPRWHGKCSRIDEVLNKEDALKIIEPNIQLTEDELFWIRLPFDDERLRVYGNTYVDPVTKMLSMTKK
jgi:hypothetical protein